MQIQPELASLISFKMRNIVLYYHLFVSFSPHRPRLKPLFSGTEPINNACDPLPSAPKGETIAVDLYPTVFTSICNTLQPVRD